MRRLRPTDLGDRRAHHPPFQAAADHLVLGAYLMATHSNGISALQQQRQLALGSYKTAWLICAKPRQAWWRPAAACSPAWSRRT
jgi:hypothetical protein